MYADHLLKPWLQCLLDQLPEPSVFDAHTHLGENDPSGFTATLEELDECLAIVDGRAAVFPLAEPGGYRLANLACAEAALRSNGTLVAFTRVTPHEAPQRLLEEGLAAGARGIKLHLSSDRFDLDDSRLKVVFETADRESLPVIVHAGPEVSALDESALEICARWSGLRLILAHCAVSSLGRLWQRLPEAPNLFFDTSWWTPAHLLAVFRLVPPGRVLNASDFPYSTPLSHTLTTARCAWQAGLDPAQIASVVGGQFRRLVEREDPLDLGAPPAAEARAPGPFLEIAHTNLLASLECMQRGDEPGIPLTVARHATNVESDEPDAPVLASISRLLDLYEEHQDRLPHRNQFLPGWDLVAAAMVVARTPAAPLP